MNKLRAGRLTLTFAAAATAITPFLADWNHTHIYNEKWPPHAKFHNGQTLAMGALLSAASIYYTWRLQNGARANIGPAVGFGSVYWIGQSLAFAFPGVAWTDPHLLKPGQSLHQFPQQVYLEVVLYGLIAAGASLMMAGSADETPSSAQA